MPDLKLSLIFTAIDRVTAPVRRIVQGTERVGQAVAATQKELSQLGKLQGDLEHFRKLKTQTGETAAKLAESQAKVAALARELKAVEAPAKKLQTEFARATHEAGKFKAELQRQEQQLNSVRGKLNEAGVSTKTLASASLAAKSAIGELNQKLAEQSAALEKINAARQKAEAAKGAMDKSLARAADVSLVGTAAQGVSAKISGVTREPISRAVEMQSDLVDYGNITGLGGDELARVRQEITALSGPVNQTTEALREALATLSAKGLESDTALGSLPAIGKTATAAVADINEVAKTSYALIDNLKVPVDQLSQSLDILAQAGKSGSFELKDMAKYFPQLTASVQALGMQGPEAVATLAAGLQVAMKGAGDPSEAANNMRNFLQKITAPETIKHFSEYGVDLQQALTNAMKSGENPVEFMLKQIQEITQGDKFALGTLFGDMQVTSFITPLLQNMEEYQKIKTEALAASGVVEKDFAARMATAKEATKAYEIASGNLKESIGSLLLPALTGLYERLTPVVNRITAWAERHPTLTRGIVLTAVSLGALAGIAAPVLFAVSSLMGSMAMLRYGLTRLSTGATIARTSMQALGRTGGGSTFGGLQSGVSRLSTGLSSLATRAIPVVLTAFRGLSLAAMANPVGLAVAGIAAAAFLIYKYWAPIKAFFAGLWSGIKEGFSAAFSGLEPVLAPLKAMFAPVGEVISWVWEQIKTLAKSFGDLLAPAKVSGETLQQFSSVGQAVGHFIGTVLAAAVAAVVDVFKALAGAVQFVWSLFASHPLDALKEAFNQAKAWIENFSFAEAGKKVIGTLAEGIKSQSGALYASVKETFAALNPLRPRSDAKEGPFSTLTASGRAIITTIGKGIGQVGDGPLTAPISAAFEGAQSRLRTPLRAAAEILPKMSLPDMAGLRGSAAMAMTAPLMLSPALSAPGLAAHAATTALATAPVYQYERGDAAGRSNPGSGGSSSAMAAGPVNHWTINITASPGTDARQLADMVRREVEQLLRRQEIDSRARLHD